MNSTFRATPGSELRIILAAPQIHSESAMVAAARQFGMQVVRRPVDAADLLAVATMESQIPVVIGAYLPRLDLEVVSRLDPLRRPVVGLIDEPGQRVQLHAFGISTIVECSADPAQALSSIAALLAPQETESPVTAQQLPSDEWDEVLQTGDGRLVAIWGPPGAPGRSTIAAELSAELARRRQRTCTVDADTYGPSLAMRLGVLDDVSGVIVACRHADNNSLTTRTLLSATRLLDERWYLLSGLGRSERWPDLRPAALTRLWAACRKTFDTTVIDVGACLEADHPVGSVGLTLERNAAARTAVASVDTVLAVSRPDSLSLTRLISALPQVYDLAPQASIRVVLNQVPKRGFALDQLRDLLNRAGLAPEIDVIALDSRAHERALARGSTIRQVAPASRARRGIQQLAQSLLA